DGADAGGKPARTVEGDEEGGVARLVADGGHVLVAEGDLAGLDLVWMRLHLGEEAGGSAQELALGGREADAGHGMARRLRFHVSLGAPGRVDPVDVARVPGHDLAKLVFARRGIDEVAIPLDERGI